MGSIINYFVQVHDEEGRAPAILGAALIIEAMITSYAHFPFTSPIVITRDALLRSILLLTHSVDHPFEQACQIGNKYEIWKHPDKERLRFVYSAFAGPSTGVPTQDNILDVVSRVKYPWQTWAKGIIRRQLLDEFKPLAARLKDPSKIPVLSKFESIEGLRPFRELVKAVQLQWEEPVMDVRFGGEGELNMEQFVEWAKKVDLLDVLDEVFGAFVQPADVEELSSDSEDERFEIALKRAIR